MNEKSKPKPKSKPTYKIYLVDKTDPTKRIKVQLPPSLSIKENESGYYFLYQIDQFTARYENEENLIRERKQDSAVYRIEVVGTTNKKEVPVVYKENRQVLGLFKEKTSYGYLASQPRTHKITKYDTLRTIASGFDTTVDEIKRINNLKRDALPTGKSIKIPQGDSKTKNNYDTLINELVVLLEKDEFLPYLIENGYIDTNEEELSESPSTNNYIATAQEFRRLKSLVMQIKDPKLRGESSEIGALNEQLNKAIKALRNRYRQNYIGLRSLAMGINAFKNLVQEQKQEAADNFLEAAEINPENESKPTCRIVVTNLKTGSKYYHPRKGRCFLSDIDSKTCLFKNKDKLLTHLGYNGESAYNISIEYAGNSREALPVPIAYQKNSAVIGIAKSNSNDIKPTNDTVINFRDEFYNTWIHNEELINYLSENNYIHPANHRGKNTAQLIKEYVANPSEGLMMRIDRDLFEKYKCLRTLMIGKSAFESKKNRDERYTSMLINMGATEYLTQGSKVEKPTESESAAQTKPLEVPPNSEHMKILIELFFEYLKDQSFVNHLISKGVIYDIVHQTPLEVEENVRNLTSNIYDYLEAYQTDVQKGEEETETQKSQEPTLAQKNQELYRRYIINQLFKDFSDLNKMHAIIGSYRTRVEKGELKRIEYVKVDSAQLENVEKDFFDKILESDFLRLLKKLKIIQDESISHPNSLSTQIYAYIEGYQTEEKELQMNYKKLITNTLFNTRQRSVKIASIIAQYNSNNISNNYRPSKLPTFSEIEKMHVVDDEVPDDDFARG